MRRLSRDATLADDLAQQVFLTLWRKLRQLKSPEQFGAWLKRVAVNEWMQHQRRNDPLWRADSVDGLDEPVAETPGLAMDLDRALAELPPRMRLCVVLAYHERMSHAEIATLTNIPTGTVKSHIRRGSARLRERLSSYEEAS